MEPMGWGDYFIVLGCCAITMLVCRVVPLFVLKGKELPEGVGQALGFIPPAARRERPFDARHVRRRPVAGSRAPGRRACGGARRLEDEIASVVRRLGCGRVRAAHAPVEAVRIGRPGRKRGGIRHYAWRAQVFAHVPRFFLAVPFR